MTTTSPACDSVHEAPAFKGFASEIAATAAVCNPMSSLATRHACAKLKRLHRLSLALAQRVSRDANLGFRIMETWKDVVGKRKFFIIPNLFGLKT